MFRDSGHRRAADSADGCIPSETRLFVQAILGNPIPNPRVAAERSRHDRELSEFAASISDRDEFHRLQDHAAQTSCHRELLEQLAPISENDEDEHRTMQQKRASAARRLADSEQFYEADSFVTEWNEADHPRAPKGTPIGGQWVEKGGGASIGAGRLAGSVEPRDSGQHQPNPHMLELAHTWWQTKRALAQARREIEDLPRRIASERTQLGSGGRYAYIHSQNLAKAQRDLEAARALAPDLEKQLGDLEQQYRDSGYDDVHYSTWTPGETLVGGVGIEQVGKAVARRGTPAGLQSTGIEFEIASAILAAPAVLRLGKTVLRKAVLKKALTKSSTGIPELPIYSVGDKTRGVLRTSSGDTPLLSGRAGPANSLAKPTPGFNAITKTHVEGHAAATMRQQGIEEATIYINNPKICIPCEQNLANMLPSGSKLTVVLPDGTKRTFIGNAR